MGDELMAHMHPHKTMDIPLDETIISRGSDMSAKDLSQKEKRGIYNVAYNGKNATLIKQDLQSVDEALKLAQGYHLDNSQKGKGAKHIKIEHLQDPTKEGYITDSELVNLGDNLRKFLKDYEPFIEKQKSGQEARIYEWVDDKGVKFRLVSKMQGGGTTANSHLASSSEIITFYSDRNLKEPMKFKNPKVEYNENLKAWHKDSHEITKNTDGAPKVFYHKSVAKDITEFKAEFDKSGIGFWFSPDKNYASLHDKNGMYETFLNIKNPLDLRENNPKYPFDIMDEISNKNLSLEPYQPTSKDAKNFLKSKGYDGIIIDGDDKNPFVVVFDSNQIKSVDNGGTFNPNDKNIYHSVDTNSKEFKQSIKEIQDGIDAIKKDNFINIKDEILRDIDSKNITTYQNGEAVVLDERRLKLLRQLVNNTELKNPQMSSEGVRYKINTKSAKGDTIMVIDVLNGGELRVQAFSKDSVEYIGKKLGLSKELNSLSFERQVSILSQKDPIKQDEILRAAKVAELEAKGDEKSLNLAQKLKQNIDEIADESIQRARIDTAEFIDKFHKANGYEKKVDAVFDAGADMLENATKTLSKNKFLKNALSLREYGKEADEIVQNYNNSMSAIYAQANKVREYLARLSTQDRITLFKALDGDETLLK